MKLLMKLTLRQLLRNRRRTLVTLLGVVISVAMITAVASLGLSFMDLLQRQSARDDGDWHVRYNQAAPDEQARLLDSLPVRAATRYRLEGFARLPGLPDAKPYLCLRAYDRYDQFFYEVVEGRFPQKEGEIALNHYIKAFAGDVALGDTLSLAVGSREGNGKTLEEDDPYWWDETAGEEEALYGLTERSYTVVGFIRQGADTEKSWAAGYTALTYLDPTLPADLYVALEPVNARTVEAAQALDVPAALNKGLLRWYGLFPDSAEVRQMAYTFLGILLAIIMAGSACLIYNAFAISVSERTRQLGMLSSVGATRVQKRNAILLEALLVGLASLPVGLGAGLGGTALAIHWSNAILLQGMTAQAEQYLRLVVSPAALAAAALLSFLTLLLSVLAPARRASKASAIDAIRQSQEVKLSARSVRTSRLTRPLFGIEGELALKNMRRHRGRYRATVFSLAVSVLLYLTVSFFSLYMTKSITLTQEGVNFDISVSGGAGENTLAILRKLLTVQPQSGHAFYRVTSADTLLNDRLAPLDTPPEPEPVFTPVEVYVLEAEPFAQLAASVGASGSGALALRNGRGKVNDRYVQQELIRAQPGDFLTLWNLADHGGPVSFPILGLLEEAPMGVDASPGHVSVLLPEPALAGVTKLDGSGQGTGLELYFRSGDPQALGDALNWIIQSGPERVYLFNASQSYRQNMQTLSVIRLFTYGFIALITAISLANIFNTLSTSVALRRREFAMLKSMGMTPASFNRMIRFESWFYGLRALLWGLPLGLASMALMYGALSRRVFRFPFTLPWGSMIAVVAAVFLLTGLTMLYSSRKARKGSIVDALKEENL